jgi:murein L,D-transpeptidase YcbB/YkuD
MAAMKAGPDNRRVELREPVPVYVVYTTVGVEDDRISFFDDIYGYDAVLARALENR